VRDEDCPVTMVVEPSFAVGNASRAIGSMPPAAREPRHPVAAADTRSFKAAGQQIGVSSSAIGKTIARLEVQLSASLFHRTTRTISLTDAGGLFLLRARRMLDELQAGEAELAEASGSPRGRLRVSLPLTRSLLTTALTAFVADYPLVELNLDYSDRMVDVIEEGFDAVIRTGETGDSRLLHKTLGRFG
jgi:DNA-binding transcriptional LysR family regulator